MLPPEFANLLHTVEKLSSRASVVRSRIFASNENLLFIFNNESFNIICQFRRKCIKCIIRSSITICHTSGDGVTEVIGDLLVTDHLQRICQCCQIHIGVAIKKTAMATAVDLGIVPEAYDGIPLYRS